MIFGIRIVSKSTQYPHFMVLFGLSTAAGLILELLWLQLTGRPAPKKFGHSLRPPGTYLTLKQRCLLKRPSPIEHLENFHLKKSTKSKISILSLLKMMRRKFGHSLRPPGTYLTLKQRCLLKRPSFIEELENFHAKKSTKSKISILSLLKTMRRKFGHSLPATWNIFDLQTTMII